MRSLNLKYLIGPLVALPMLGAALYAVHEFQVRRSAVKLLEQADHAEESGRKDRAARILDRYLKYRPDDADALARYGLLLADMDRSRGSIEGTWLVLERALGRRPDREDVRRRLVELALVMGRYADARMHAQELLKLKPDDGELEAAIGRCEQAEMRFESAAAWYEKAIAHDPTRKEAYVHLSFLLRTELGEPDRADEVMDALVAANDRVPAAHLARASYLFGYGSPEEAAEDVAVALKQEPDHVEGLLLAARVAASRSDWDEAGRHLRRGLEIYPGDPRFPLDLADVEIRAGRPDQAEACLVAGIRESPDDGDLRSVLANLQIERDELEQARATIDDLGNLGHDKGQIGYLEARLLVARREWSRASEALEAVAPLLIEQPELTRRANLMLAHCYEQLGDTDRRAAAYRRIADADPRARAGLADSLEALGRYDEALAQYRLMSDPTPEARQAIARILILRNLRLPIDRRRWEEAEAAIEEAARAAPDSPTVPILRAEVLAARDRIDEAIALLESAREAQPDRFELVAGLVALAERRGTPEAIPPLLDEAERRMGDRADLRLLRARYLSVHGGPDAAGLVNDLGRDLDRFSPDDRRRLLRGLAEEISQSGDDPRALALWSQAVDERPEDLNGQILAFDLALRAGDEAAQGRALARIEAIEGDGGTLGRYSRARQIIAKARGERSTELRPARALLAEVATRRPTWARVPLAEGEIDELQGNINAAIAHYLRAIDLGERDVRVTRHVLQLLSDQGRHEEANLVLSRLQDRSINSAEIRRLASEVSFRNHDYTRALELAEKAVAAGSSDYRDHVWLGQMRWLLGRRAEAEPPLRRAIELAGDDPSPTIALVHYLIASGKPAEADRAVAEAAGRDSAPKEPMALARCYEAIGRMEEAGALYQRAAEADPGDIATLRGLAAFLVRQGRSREAEPHLERLIGLKSRSPEDADWARRLLAMVLTTDADPGRARRALEIVGLGDEPEDRPASPAAEPVEDLRLKARVLAARRDDRQRREATRLLEEIVRRDPVDAGDLLLLAQLHEFQGDWPKADAQMRRLLELDEEEPDYLVKYIQALLRNGRADEAGPWLDRLTGLRPDALETTQLRAMVLSARGEDAEAASLLEDFAGKHEDQAIAVAWVLERTGSIAPAEKVLRMAVGRDRAEGGPATLALAVFLGRRGRTDEALDLCEPAWEAGPIDAAIAASLGILNTQADDAQLRRVEGWLRSAERASPGETAIAIATAILRILQGQPDEAEAIYRRIIAQEPGNVVALNNLAWILARTRGNHAEAMELVDRAIKAAGAQSALLDTRAVIQLSMGHNEQAIRDLEAAIASGPLAPMFFHLAEAYSNSDRQDAARDALRAGEKLGLKATSLDPMERPAFTRLVESLARNP